MYSLGIDIGYSSLKLTLIDEAGKVKKEKYLLHQGRVKEKLQKVLQELVVDYNSAEIGYGAVVGSGGKLLAATKTMPVVNEVAAIVEGSLKAAGGIKSIVEIGGQSAKYITEFSAQDKSRIEIGMNSNCSAGTGSFLEEQMSRLNLKLEDYSRYAARAQSIPRIAGRCSVFAKTDIIHHQQEGVPVADILLGLAYAVVKNYKGAVMRRLPVKKPLLLIGGVAHNQGIITALKDVLNLAEGELVIPASFGNIGAWGAALIAQKESLKIDLAQLWDGVGRLANNQAMTNQAIALPKLSSYGLNDSRNKHHCKPLKSDNAKAHCYLGVDVGSTSTNLVLINEAQEMVAFKYLRTLGDPVAAVTTGLRELNEEWGGQVQVIGAGTTGSGRYMIGELLGADVVKDEITAQAKAAATIDPEVDTIFEIGGQDSKYISLKDGAVIDFQMNKVCAAGTGSFLEEQAKKFNIPINKFGKLALASERPINLGERCTVFMETNVASALANGARLEDICSGLCYAIVRNYLDRVVGPKRIGSKIFFQGGVAFNQGVVNAFRSQTGKQVIVPPFFSVTGAYGVALLTQAEMNGQVTKFKGFNVKSERESVTGPDADVTKTAAESKFAAAVNRLVFMDYDGMINPEQETIGIPRALFTFGMFPMFNAFFKALGYNVLLSDPTNENTIRLGQEYSLDETCYPVKLIMGHAAELVNKKVDYIFFPDLYTVDHPGSHTRKNFGCPYMQLAFKMMNQAMDLENKGIKLLAPTMAFNLGQQFMMQSFGKLGVKLGKNQEQIKAALQQGMKAFHEFESRMMEDGLQALRSLPAQAKGFVLISKIYGVADPVLNLGIPDKFMDMGYQVFPFYNLPEGDIALEHPNMYWPFGQHILEPVQLVREHPNLYAVLLTHHGCGPDSVLTHYFREAMGPKPYLHIEVDEHSSKVGVITRVEAFVNSLKQVAVTDAADVRSYLDRVEHQAVNLKADPAQLQAGATLYLPWLYPYSELLKTLFNTKGINAAGLPPTDAAAIELGRKFNATEEYFSLTAFLGTVFQKLPQLNTESGMTAFWVPQYEGAEVDGQYHRLLRTKLDEAGFDQVDIVTPYLEDLLENNEIGGETLFLTMAAGDLIMAAPLRERPKYLQRMVELITSCNLTMDNLMTLAAAIRQKYHPPVKRRILVSGEFSILFNPLLNNGVLTEMEEQGYQVLYASLSEALWLTWRDYVDQNKLTNEEDLRQKLQKIQNNLRKLARCLGEAGPFEREPEELVTLANQTVGFYSGAGGRYRVAKVLGDLPSINGVITVASLYENTGIALNVLQKGFTSGNKRPLLNLVFDGNRNENDRTKLQSFLYYL
jgi:predicted CoA-substrate-specific enzyme activase